MKVVQSCPTPCDSMNYIVHRILQATILEWMALPISRGSSQPRDQNQESCIAEGFSTSWVTKVRHKYCSRPYSLRTDKILCRYESEWWLGNGENLKKYSREYLGYWKFPYFHHGWMRWWLYLFMYLLKFVRQNAKNPFILNSV